MSCDSWQTKSTTFYPKPEATSSAPIRASNFLSFMDWKPFDAITASFMAFFVFKIFSLRECGFEPQLNTVLKRNHFMVPTIQSNSIQLNTTQDNSIQYNGARFRPQLHTVLWYVDTNSLHPPTALTFLVFRVGMWCETSPFFDLSDSHELSRKPETAVLL